MNRRKIMKRRVLLVIPVILILVLSFSTIVGASAGKKNAKDTYYKAVLIESGDSLWSIAQENFSEECGSIEQYISDIKKFNGITDDCIHAGNYISIPYYTEN